MKILIKPGQTLVVGFEDEDGFELDGKITVGFDSGVGALWVDADLPDSEGREGRIYEETFGPSDEADKVEVSGG